MSQIKAKDTKPELKFRKYLFSKGLRGYRVSFNIAGKPDIAFTRYKVAIFIDGCFWHKCPKCFKEPVTNKVFWANKINSNVKRDIRNNKTLSELGWITLRYWEHEINGNIDKCYTDLYMQLKGRGYRDATS